MTDVPGAEVVDRALYDGYTLPLFGCVLWSVRTGHQHTGDIVQEPMAGEWQQAAEFVVARAGS